MSWRGRNRSDIGIRWFSAGACYRILLFVICLRLPSLSADNAQVERPSLHGQPAAAAGSAVEWARQRTQDINQLSIGWYNTGTIAWAGGRDYCTEQSSYNLTFPKGLPLVYGNLQLWFGAEKQGDTLVTTTLDWIGNGPSLTEVIEMWPAPPPDNEFVERSSRPGSHKQQGCVAIDDSVAAISEFDLISVCTDTITDQQLVNANPIDGRPHRPLGLKLTSRSYGWSYPYANDFVLVHYTLENIGYHNSTVTEQLQQIRRLYVGILQWDHVFNYDVKLDTWGRGGGGDDHTEWIFDASLPNRPEITDVVNMMWRWDNDGDPLGGQFDNFSATSGMAFRVLSPGIDEKQFSYNWWNYWPSLSGPTWGPVRSTSKVEFEAPELGLPQTDRVKYQLMTNSEHDYPTREVAIPHQSEGWLPPPTNGGSLAAGAIPWALLSFGPYDLELGDTVSFVVAIVGGEHVHSDPFHFANSFNAARPDAYYQGLDISDLVQNAYWAGWMYDTPGLDTDGDGYRGEFAVLGGDTIFHRGDGVPDFSGPPPPAAPFLVVTNERSSVNLRWNGRNSESSIDPFLNRRDFEGYRVYMSRTGQNDDWALVAQRDLVNFDRLTWNRDRSRWQLKDPPFNRDSLKKLYDSLSFWQYGYPFEPDSFSDGTLDGAFMEIRLDPVDPANLDTLFRYFRPHEVNDSIDDVGLARADSAGLKVRGRIRKLYPLADTSDVMEYEDGSDFRPAYEYELSLDGFHVAEPVYFAATAFDHGDPATGLEPLESAKMQSVVEVWPVNSAATVKEERSDPGVYPNPYRLIDDYYGNHWENRQGLEPDKERARQVTFYNVPDTCTVSIWSLDGDLVRKIKHNADPGSSEATVVRWDLITRNTQAVKTGIYIWSVESRFGTDVGKLVIIK